jgi:DNA sulfur modification protein DndD
MILEELVLHNFGVYEGRQQVALAPPDRHKPLVLFGGLNGGGKTTLLDGIQLALYGKLAHCSNRGALSYEEFLRRSINRSVDSTEGAALELQFRFLADSHERVYRVHRSWSCNGDAVRERVEVRRDGAFDRTLTEHWLEHIEEFLPRRLSQLFFFDGEKVEALADADTSRELLAAAIHGLLGLDLVDQLDADLVVLERRKRIALREPVERSHVEAQQQEVEILERRRRELVERRAALQNELDRGEKDLREADEQFRLAGGDLYRERASIEQLRATTAAELRRLEDDLREVAAGISPLLLLVDLLRDVELQAAREASAREAERIHEVLIERDQRVLKAVGQFGATPSLVKKLAIHLARDRAEGFQTDGGERHLDLSVESQRELSGLTEQFSSTRRRTSDLLRQTAAQRRTLDELDRKLAGVPDGDAVAAIIAAHEAARQRQHAATVRLADLDQELGELSREMAQRRARLASQLEKLVMLDLESEDSGRVLAHSERVRGSLRSFRQAVLARHLGRIQTLVLESLAQLLRKESLVTDLRIDPENFGLTLYGSDRLEVSPDRLSAGERQLLAVSILWGLARASGRPLPKVIDTPLGRLDASHREHLVSRYFPHASHQVLLLSTDEEIDERRYGQLRPWVGRSYRLEFDDSVGSTKILPGYFGQEQETQCQ